MSIFGEGRDTYVRVTIDGPFGEMQQVSAPMKMSEAEATRASIQKGMNSRLMHHVIKAEIVKLRYKV